MKGVVQTKFFIFIVVVLIVLVSYCKDTKSFLILQIFRQLFSEIIIIFSFAVRLPDDNAF
jgi:hypothetical protein